MTLFLVLRSLRTMLIEAEKKKDRVALEELYATLSVLRDIAHEHADGKTIVGIITRMIDTARDGIGGVSWKSDLPSIHEIETACQEVSN